MAPFSPRETRVWLALYDVRKRMNRYDTIVIDVGSGDVEDKQSATWIKSGIAEIARQGREGSNVIILSTGHEEVDRWLYNSAWGLASAYVESPKDATVSGLVKAIKKALRGQHG